MDFDEWIVANFGEDWQENLSISEAKMLYKNFLVSEWPLAK